MVKFCAIFGWDCRCLTHAVDMVKLKESMVEKAHRLLLSSFDAHKPACITLPLRHGFNFQICFESTANSGDVLVKEESSGWEDFAEVISLQASTGSSRSRCFCHDTHDDVAVRHGDLSQLPRKKRTKGRIEILRSGFQAVEMPSFRWELQQLLCFHHLHFDYPDGLLQSALLSWPLQWLAELCL